MAGRVSVVTPIYNPGPLLRTCLDSALRQTYGDLEIVPVDDAGPEPVRAVLEEFARKDPRVRPVFNESNVGLAASLNRGVRAATGEYILVLEQDCELLEPEGIERAMALVGANPKWCLTGAVKLPLGEMRPAEVAFAVIRNHTAAQREADLTPISFAELKCDLFPRAAIDSAGGFDETFTFSGEDQVMSHRLSKKGWAMVRTKALAFTLRSGAQVTLSSNLRREFVYGRTQAAILLSTAFKSIDTSQRLPQGKQRLTNRALACLSAGSVVLLPILALLGVGLLGLLALLFFPLLRIGVVGMRCARIAGQLPRPAPAVALSLAVVLVDDIVYAAALAAGAMKYAVARRT